MNSSVPPGLTLPAAWRATWSASKRCSLEGAAHLVDVHVEQAPVVRAAGRDHHVVDRVGQAVEEPLERSRIVGVEGRGAQRVELARGLRRGARDRGR